MTSKDLKNAFDDGIDSLQWGLIKNKANVHVHTSECLRFRYFFDGAKYPCILSHERWTDWMTELYLEAPTCGFYLPELDYDVIRNWERESDDIGFFSDRGLEEEQVTNPRYEELRQKIEHVWLFVKHWAEKLHTHSATCQEYKCSNGKYCCLQNFAHWDWLTLREYIEPRPECPFL